MKPLRPLALAGALMLAQIAAAESVTLVTTHPAADYEPTVSPDGRWLVYTSDRAGAPGLYLRDLRSTTPRPDEALFPHPARTSSPVFSPDGRWLAFVSSREDALGDVFLANFRDRSIRRVSTVGRIDARPFFSADGRQLFFESTRINEETRLYSHTIRGGETTESEAPVFEPLPPYPMLSLDRNGGAALLYSDDTNGDGTLGAGDDATPWELIDGTWRQAHTPLRQARGISRNARTNELLVGVDWRGNDDIVAIGETALRGAATAEELLAEARRALNARDPRVDDAIALQRAAIERATDPAVRARAAVQYIRALVRAGRDAQAFRESELLLAETTGERERLALGAARSLARLGVVTGAEAEEAEAELRALLPEIESSGAGEMAGWMRLALARFLAERGRYPEGLSETERAMALAGPESGRPMVARATLLRAAMFREMGLGSDLRDALFQIFESDVTDSGILADAAGQLISDALQQARTADERVLRLRDLASQAEQYPELLAKVRLAEGRQLLEMEDFAAAIRAFSDAAAQGADAPASALEAADQLARIEGAREDHNAAIALYRQLDDAYQVAENEGLEEYRNAVRERLATHYLQKARIEHALGDPLLALATYETLLSDQPRLPAAWRGAMAAMSTQEGLIESRLSTYRQERRDAPRDPLAWYKEGLAESYINPASRGARRSLETAVSLDPSEPYYYLTLGFVLEQQYRQSKRPRARRLALLEESALAYEQALLLSDRTFDPHFHADALLNSGNAALELGQYFRAHDFYRRREEATVPFTDQRTEFLFHYNSGLAAFRSSFPAVSAAQFSEAAEMIGDLVEEELIPEDRGRALELDLLGRRALALMEARQFAESASLFERLYNAAPERSLRRVRALRNQAVVTERQVQRVEGVERVKLIQHGREIVARAIEELQVPDLRDDSITADGGGLLNLSMVFSTDSATGGAALSFDREGELRLLHALKARFAQLEGAHGDAMLDLQEQIALSPEITDENRAYYFAAQSVAYSRLAGEAMRAGQPEQALQFALEGLARCRFTIAGVEFINGPGATRMMAQAAELAVRIGEPDLQRADAFWMLPADALSMPPWEVLRAAAIRLSAMPDPAIGDPTIPLISDPVEQARLSFVRALAAERLYHAARLAPAGDGLETLRWAASMAPLVAELASESAYTRQLAESASASTEEGYRLAILAMAAELRVEFSLERDGAAERLEEAQQFARETGHAHLEWWLAAQAALSTDDAPLRAERAGAALDVYTTQVEYSPARVVENPWLLFDELEAAQLAVAVAEENPEACWEIVDAWRTARLRWLAEQADPFPIGDEDRAWLARYRDLRATAADAQQRLRSLPHVALARRDSAIREYEVAGEALRVHASAGVASEHPTARFLRPESVPFDYAAILLEPPFLVPREPMLILQRTLPGVTLRAVYTPEESRFIAAEEILPDNRELFVFGDLENIPEGATQILDTAGFYGKFQKLSLRADAGAVKYPREGQTAPDPVALQELVLASDLHITRPVRAMGRTPQAWTLDGETLREVLARASDLETLSLSVEMPTALRPGVGEAMQLALAAWLDQQGIVRATINGDRWLGLPLDPRLMPALAEEEIMVAEGALDQALSANQARESAISLERIIAIMEALGDTRDLDYFYGELAQQRARLGRWSDAHEAATRRVEVLRETDAEPALLAEALDMLGAIATRARRWTAAEEAYGEAIGLYEELGDEGRRAAAMRDLAISLENSGEYQRALSMGSEAQAMLADIGQRRAVLEQEIRAARIQRVYLNDYATAEATLSAAAEKAAEEDWRDLRIEALMNLVRTLHATARFDEAMILLDRIEREVRDAGLEDYIGQIFLERANIAWYRADYFDSFRDQQRALEIAEDTGNIPLKIAVHNVSGLTSWTVNDLQRAFAELERALVLAEREGIDAEVATTANNLGLLYRSQQDFTRALDWFNRALEIDRIQSNRWGQAYALRNIGITLTQSELAAEALEPLAQAIELSTAIGDRVNAAKALLAIADAHAELGDYAAAREPYERALHEARSVVLPEVEWRALHGLGRIALAESDQETALARFGDAIDVVDILRAAIRIEEFQDGFLLDKLSLYDSMISLRIDRGEHAAALEMSEKSRGRNFIDLLGNRRLNLSQGQDEELLRREEELRSRIETLERALVSANEANRAELSGELAQARTAYSDFLIVLRTQSPQLSAFVRVQPVDVAELQALLETDTRLVVYHALPDRVVAWILGPGSLDFVQLPGTPEQLAQDIMSTRAALQDFLPVDDSLARLGAQVATPLLPYLDGVTRLGFVPHQQMHTLPFAALRFENGDHLVDRFALFYTPSASVLRYTMSRRDERMQNNRVLAIGNPDRGEEMNLPFAEKEAERLRFSFDEVTVRVGGEASETWLRENLTEYGIVHIASHGEYKPEAPLFSAVLLAPDAANDGVLSAEEVFSLELRADLVALSACQSGLGRVGNGDDIVGLNRSFVYAGTRQMLTTLWRVDDVSTAVLFKYFYRNQDGMDRAEALRAAQVRLKNRPEYRHPAHWSGLVLSGDWQ